jgi:hypothetical protein
VSESPETTPLSLIVAMALIERPNGSGLTWDEAEEIGRTVAIKYAARATVPAGPLDVERLTGEMVALDIHEGMHDWTHSVREGAEFVAAEYAEDGGGRRWRREVAARPVPAGPETYTAPDGSGRRYVAAGPTYGPNPCIVCRRDAVVAVTVCGDHVPKRGAALSTGAPDTEEQP